MPTDSIQLQIVKNGGAPSTSVVTAAFSDTILLKLASSSGVKRVKYRIYEFPEGFALPAGWTMEAANCYSVTVASGGDAPVFSLPASGNDLRGKYFFDAVANDQIVNGAIAGGLRSKARLKIPMATAGIEDVGHLETNEFDEVRQYTSAIKKLVRVLDQAVLSGGGVTAHSLLSGLSSDDHSQYDFARRPPSTYTAASNDAALLDGRKCIITTRATAISLRIRLQASIAWVGDDLLGGINTGAGILTITAEGGVTLNGSVTVPQNGWWWAKRTALNTWHCFTGGTSSGGDFKADGTVAATGNFNLGSHKITALQNGAAASQDAATVAQMETAIASAIAGAGGGGGDGFSFTFSALTADADPGAGMLRLSSATPASITQIFVDLTDASSNDITAWLDRLDDSVGSVKGYIRVGSKTDKTKWLLFSLASVTTATGYRKLGVTYVAGPALPLTTTGDCFLSFESLGLIGTLPWSSIATAIGNLGFTGLKSLSYNGEIDNTGATPAINFTTGDLQKLTLSGNTSPTFVAPAGVGYVLISTIGDGTQRTITWPGSVVGTPPAPAVTGRTFYPLFYDGTSYHYDAAAATIIAGNGLLDTSGTFSVKPDGATIGVSASGVKVADASIGNTQLATGLSWSKFASAIGDLAFTGAKFISYTAEYDNGNSSTADTITFANGLYQKSTLTGNCTFTFVAPTGVGEIQLKLIQDGTGSRTVTWPVGMVWPASGAPTLSTTPGDSDIVAIYYDGTNYYGSYITNGSSVTAGNGITDTAGIFSVDAADGTLVVGAPGVKRAPITGDVTIADGSNASVIAADAVTTTKILNDAVTYPKIQNVSAASRALGRGSAGGAGDVEELAFTGGLSVSGTNITIADGALSWAKLAAAIGDLAFTGLKYISYTAEYDNGNSGTADTIVFANGLHQKSTLTGNCTFTFTPPTGVGTIQLKLIQDATGSRTVTWPATMIWPAGGAPTLSTVAGDTDIVSIYWDGTNYWGSSDNPIPDGRVARWDDASGTLFTSTFPTGGGKIAVDPALGLEWQGKNGVETTLAQHGDSGNTTKRRLIAWKTQPVRTTGVTGGVQFTTASVDCSSVNGRAITNAVVHVRAKFLSTNGYIAYGEYSGVFTVDGSSVPSNHPAGLAAASDFTGAGGVIGGDSQTQTFDFSGSLIRHRVTPGVSNTATEYLAWLELDVFEP